MKCGKGRTNQQVKARWTAELLELHPLGVKVDGEHVRPLPARERDEAAELERRPLSVLPIARVTKPSVLPKARVAKLERRPLSVLPMHGHRVTLHPR